MITNPSEILWKCLKECIFVKESCMSSICSLCRKINSTASIFQLICLPFANTCSKENFAKKSNNFEMEDIFCYSRCIALYFQLLQLVRFTDRWSTLHKTRMKYLIGQHFLSCATNKKTKGYMDSTVWKYTVES